VVRLCHDQPAPNTSIPPADHQARRSKYGLSTATATGRNAGSTVAMTAHPDRAPTR
jgi:hypothetical protein